MTSFSESTVPYSTPDDKHPEIPGEPRMNPSATGDWAGASAPVLCGSCDFANPPYALHCRGCFRPLLGDTVDCQPAEEGERVLMLSEACEHAVSHRWTADQFNAWFDKFFTEQKVLEESIRELEIPFGLEEDFADEMEAGWSGVGACNQGLSILKNSPQDGEYREGLRLFWRGVRQVKEAMDINRLNADRDMWG